MRYLYCDLETYSEIPIGHGVYRYAETAEVLLWAYAIDDGPVKVWDRTTGEDIPYDLHTAIYSCSVTTVWHNGLGFDIPVLRAALPRLCPPVKRVVDTAMRARMHGLPAGLEDLCKVFGLSADVAKQKTGKALIQLFCKPRPKNSKLRRATRETHPDKWAEFVEYASHDVLAMRELHRLLPTVNETNSELALLRLDHEINARGVAIDRDLAHAAIRANDKAQAELADQAASATDGDVRSATQRDSVLRHIEAVYGIKMPDLRAATVEQYLEDPSLPAAVRELLQVRLQASMTSVAKFAKLVGVTSSDGRLRGALQFCGASRTGRWSGKLFQPQNLPRPTLSQTDIDLGIEALKLDSADLLYDDVKALISSAVRGAIVAPEGKKLVCSDLSNIEGRLLAWVAGERWKIDAFAAFDRGEGEDLYKRAYARAFNIPVDEVKKDQRQVGKVMELACLAADTKVVTNNGVKPIVEVSSSDLLWDGQEWVEHKGLIARGARRVVDVAGIKVTPDHLIKTGRIWTPAQQLVSCENTLCLALETASASSPLSHWKGGNKARATTLWSALPALAVLRRTWCSITTCAKVNLRAAMPAPKNKVPTGVRTTGLMRMLSPTMTTDGVCLTGYLRASTGAIQRQTVGTTTTAPEGSKFSLLGARIAERFLNTLSRSTDGTTLNSKSTGSTWMRGMPPATSDSSHTEKTKKTEGKYEICKRVCSNSNVRTPTYDIAFSGPRNCFTVLSDKGPLIVHNCGYEGGVGAFVSFANVYGINLTAMASAARPALPDHVIDKATRAWFWAVENDRDFDLPKEVYIVCDAIKRLWRAAHPNVTKLWAEAHAAYLSALHGVKTTGFGADQRLRVKANKNWLLIWLPSGRVLCYREPRVVDSKLAYMGVDQYTRRWRRINTHGGKLVENIVQALARDVLASAMPEIESWGYRIVLTVHDEVITEAPEGFSVNFTPEHLSKILATPPEWADGLPLAAEGFEAKRYRK